MDNIFEENIKLKKQVEELEIENQKLKKTIDLKSEDESLVERSNQTIPNIIKSNESADLFIQKEFKYELDEIKNISKSKSDRDLMIVNVYDRKYVVSEKKHGKRIFIDALAEQIGIGLVFDSYKEATKCVEQFLSDNNYAGQIEITYTKYLNAKAFKVWVTCLSILKSRFSVFITLIDEKLSEKEIEERAFHGIWFNHYYEAHQFADDVVAKYNNIFFNNDSFKVEVSSTEDDNDVEYVYDNDCQPVLIRYKEKFVKGWRTDDIRYFYIDVDNYSRQIKEKFLQSRNNRKSSVGEVLAYEYAEFASIASLRLEVFRTSLFLDSLLKENDELFVDVDIYKSYKSTLIECIEIQKRFAINKTDKVNFIVFDQYSFFENVDDITRMNFNSLVFDDKAVRRDLKVPYSVKVYNTKEELLEAIKTDDNSILLATIHSAGESYNYFELQKEVYDLTEKTIYCCKITKKRTFYKYIKEYIRQKVNLSFKSSNIDNQWLELFSNIENDEDVYDENGFGKDGIHRNGTPFDDDGFNIRGYDMYGYPKTIDHTMKGSQIARGEGTPLMDASYFKQFGRNKY